MQPEVVVFFFSENLIITKSFQLFLKVFFLCVSFFKWDHFDICQGAVYVHLGLFSGGKCPFRPNFIGGQMSEGAYVIHIF